MRVGQGREGNNGRPGIIGIKFSENFLSSCLNKWPFLKEQRAAPSLGITGPSWQEALQPSSN